MTHASHYLDSNLTIREKTSNTRNADDPAGIREKSNPQTDEYSVRWVDE